MTRTTRPHGGSSRGAVRLEVVILVALLLFLAAAGAVAVVSRGEDEQDRAARPDPTVACLPKPGRTGPRIDLGVDPATGRDDQPLLSMRQVGRLVGLANQAGAGIVSTPADWSVLRPEQAQPYDWTGLDRVIDAARAVGLKLRVQLVGLPAWARDTDSGSRTQPPLTPHELRLWSAFVRDVVRHVETRVDYLEVWDEPDTEAHWSTGPDPAAFVRLLQASSTVVERQYRAITVVSGGLAGNDIGFLEQMYAEIGRQRLADTPFEMLGVHPFSGDLAPGAVAPIETGPFGDTDPSYTGFRRLHQVMTDHGDDDLDLYLGGFGYSTRAHDGVRGVSDTRRATYLTEAFRAATCSPYVAVMSWYYFHPTPDVDDSWTLLDADLKPNRTYSALADWSVKVADAD